MALKNDMAVSEEEREKTYPSEGGTIFEEDL